MYGIFTYIWLIFMVNVGKYTVHGSYGISQKMYKHWRHAIPPWKFVGMKKNLSNIQICDVHHLGTFIWKRKSLTYTHETWHGSWNHENDGFSNILQGSMFRFHVSSCKRCNKKHIQKHNFNCWAPRRLSRYFRTLIQGGPRIQCMNGGFWPL